MSGISYLAISPEELDRMIREASQPDEFVKPDTAAKRFDCSKDFLEEMNREGKIKKYTVPGHPKIKRYKLKELQNLFKPE